MSPQPYKCYLCFRPETSVDLVDGKCPECTAILNREYPKHSCTPEEMKLRSGGPWTKKPGERLEPPDHIHVKPGNIEIIEGHGLKMKVVPLARHFGRKQAKELGKFYYDNIPGLIEIKNIISPDCKIYGNKSILKIVNREIRRQKLKRLIKRLTPLAWAMISAIVSTQILLLSLKIAGLTSIKWGWIYAPVWWPMCFVAGYFLPKGIEAFIDYIQKKRGNQ